MEERLKKSKQPPPASRADWADGSVSELEGTLMGNLDAMFKTAIRDVMDSVPGCVEETATYAVLKAGPGCGPKDTVSNIVEKASAFLRGVPGLESSLMGEGCGEQLRELERSVLDEMVRVVRELQPSMSRGDALWRLLIFDMDVSRACVMGCGHSSWEQAIPDLSALCFDKAKAGGSPGSASARLSASISLRNKYCSHNAGKGVNALSDRVVEETSSSSMSKSALSDEKLFGGMKGHFGSKRDANSRVQKPFHVGMSRTKTSARGARRANWMNLENTSEALSDFEANFMRNALMKLDKTVASDKTLVDPMVKVSLKDGRIKSIYSSTGRSDVKSGVPSGVPKDKMDEMLEKLVPCVKELEAQMKEWSDWAQQKVMQAAWRLSKDKPVKQNLQQEGKAGWLAKENQAFKESTRSQLAEMESAVSKACSQVSKSHDHARLLEQENSELKKEMEAAKSQAAESATSCEEVIKRELEALKQLESLEREKAQLNEELKAEKKKATQVQHKLEQAKEHYNQVEVRRKQEEKAKDEALVLYSAHRKEREQTEVSGRSKENEMKLKAETDMQRYKNDIKKLEQQIVDLRRRTDPSKIAPLRWGTERRKESSKGQLASRFFNLQEPDEDEVQRDSECVMCLTEEKSVLFLPCAHQVVCAKCSESHEKQGMTDCPSCRTVIEKRVLARFPGS